MNTVDDIENYTDAEIGFMRQAIAAMRLSIPETGKTNPGVGAVIVLPGGEVHEAYRARLRDGDHCEQTLLSKGPLADTPLRGSRLFVTLEPCSKRPTERPCAKRIIEAGIAEVFYGIRDPNPTINGNGLSALVEADIRVRPFPTALAAEIRDANADWLEHMKREIEAEAAKAERAKVRARREAAAKTATKPAGDFLEHVHPRATTEDLSDEALEVYRAARGVKDGIKSMAFLKVLYKAGLVAEAEHGAHLTNLGVVLLAGDVRQFLPQAGVVMIRHNPGTTNASRRIEVPVALVWDAVFGQLHAPDWFPTYDDRSGPRKVEGVSPLPDTAIREAVLNGVAHRDYRKKEPVELLITPDEIKITSPGGPVKPVRLDDLQAFRAKRALRNPVLFQQMTDLGLVEQSHLGMETFRNLPQTDGLPLPAFAEENGVLTFTIFRKAEATARAVVDRGIRLSRTQVDGWTKISGLESVSTSEYAALTGYSLTTARDHLGDFAEKGIVQRVGEGPAIRYRILR